MTVQAASNDGSLAVPSSENESLDGSTYECNICLGLGREPVVTMCGHLYCWSCLYTWMQVQSHCRMCPVCKAGIDEDKVIPIYGRGGPHQDPRGKQNTTVDLPVENQVVPRRPAGQRFAPIIRGTAAQHSGSVALQPGLGIIPMLFGLNTTSGTSEVSEPLTPEQQHQILYNVNLSALPGCVRRSPLQTRRSNTARGASPDT